MKYAFNGIPGCAFTSLSIIGSSVSLRHVKQSGWTETKKAWACVCEEHQTYCYFNTMDEAMEHVFLADWCEPCLSSLTSGQSYIANQNALALSRGPKVPPIFVTPAQNHDPLIFQKQTSFVGAFSATVTPYEGCEYSCLFCYVPQILHGLAGHRGGWGNYARPRFRCREFLQRQANRLQGARLFLSATTDPYQRVERKYGLTRSLLEALIEIPFDFLLISTRGALVMRDLDLFTDPRMRNRIEIGISITSDLASVHDACEHDTASYNGRFAIARKLRDAGIPVRIHAAPLGVHSPDFLKKVMDSADWAWFDGAGHGARQKEPGKSFLLSHKEAQSIAQSAAAHFGGERVGYGSTRFGWRWNRIDKRIEPARPLLNERQLILTPAANEER